MLVAGPNLTMDRTLAIAELARWLTAQQIATRTGKTVWDRSTVWGMLRNPAYHGPAAYGKTKVADRHGKPTRTTRARGERRGECKRGPAGHRHVAPPWRVAPASVRRITARTLATSSLGLNGLVM